MATVTFDLPPQSSFSTSSTTDSTSLLPPTTTNTSAIATATTTTTALPSSSSAATSCATEFIEDHVAMAARLMPTMPKVNIGLNNTKNSCNPTTAFPETADGVLYGMQMVANELAFACTPLHGHSHGGGYNHHHSNSHFDSTNGWSRSSSAAGGGGGVGAPDVYPGVSLRRSKMNMNMAIDDYSFTNSKTRSLLRGQRATQFMNKSKSTSTSKTKNERNAKVNDFMWELEKKLHRNLNLANGKSDRVDGGGRRGRGAATGRRKKPKDEGYYEDLLLHGDGASSKGSRRSPPPSMLRLSSPYKYQQESQEQQQQYPSYQHPGAVGTYVVAHKHHNMMDDNTTLTSVSGSYMEPYKNMQPRGATARTSAPRGYSDEASEASSIVADNNLLRNSQDVFRPKSRHNMAELRSRFGDLKMMTSSNRLSSQSEQWMQEAQQELQQQQQQQQVESRQDQTASHRRRRQDDKAVGQRSVSPSARQRPSVTTTTTSGVGTKKKRSKISSSHSSSMSPTPQQMSSSRGGGRKSGGGYSHQRRRSKQHRRGDDWDEDDSEDDEHLKAPTSWTPPSPPGMTLDEKQRKHPIVVEDENDDGNGRPAAAGIAGVVNTSDPKSYPNPFLVIKKADKPSKALNAEELYQTAYHSKKNRDIDELKERLSKPNRVPPTVPDYLQETLKGKLERANESLKSLQKVEQERHKSHHQQQQQQQQNQRQQQPPSSSYFPKW